MDDAKALLLINESRLERRKNIYISFLPSTNLVNKNPSNNSIHAQQYSLLNGPQLLLYQPHCERVPYFGRERGRMQCQLCDKICHIVVTYWFCFDRNYIPPSQTKTNYKQPLISLY